MDSQNVIGINRRASSLKILLWDWMIERKEFIVPFFVLFVIIDPLITYVGISAFNIDEGNFIVSTVVQAENGWMIWLTLKTAFGLVGTMFMFSAYYAIKTGKLSDSEKEKAIIFEYGAWSFLICFIFIIILHWASIIILE